MLLKVISLVYWRKTDQKINKEPNGNLTKIQEESLKLASLTQKFKNFGKDKSKESAGYIYLWGSGKDGRLGNGSEKSEKLPVAITDTKFIALSCSYHHSAAISEDSKTSLFFFNSELLGFQTGFTLGDEESADS